jgi:hypothetical protein
LIEVLVVLAIMGTVLGVSGLALASLNLPRETDALRGLRQAREQAIRTGTPMRFQSALFLPDGRVIGTGIDPLTGAVRDSAR